jgi:large subunit ribosomal protein L6
MSRIGKKPVAIPSGVTVDLNGKDLTAKGPKGTLHMTFVDDVVATVENNVISVQPRNSGQKSRSMWGMQRTLADNIVTGVSKGFSRTLEINGVGYRAALRGRELQLQLGFSHEVLYPLPEGIEVQCPEPTKVVISGIDKQKVGHVAAEIREYRKPEPYKGKGVKYSDEYIYRKEGKKK